MLGMNTSHFTTSHRLFLANPHIDLWTFEVVYSFPTETSSSALTFRINQPPFNGSCSIEPSNGTTTSPFNVSCPSWFDQDGIKDYSLYRTSTFNRSAAKTRLSAVLVSSSVPEERTIIAFSSVSTFQVQLPTGNYPSFSLALIISIRDTRDCITYWNLTSIVVRPDSGALDDLLTQLEDPSNGSTNNPFIELLSKGNGNTVGQVITSLSQQLNHNNKQNLQDAVEGMGATLPLLL
jgi:REJ domain